MRVGLKIANPFGMALFKNQMILMRSVVTLIGPLLIFFTAYSSFASPVSEIDSNSSVCEASLHDWQRALNYNHLKKGGVTQQADRFMHLMWASFLKKDKVEAVQSEIFTKFVHDHIEEAKTLHLNNQEFAKKDLIDLGPDEVQQIHQQFYKINRYLESLANRINKGPDLTYMEQMVFAYMLVLIRERSALENLQKLADQRNEALIQQRYPGSSLLSVRESLKESRENLKSYWLKFYTYRLVPGEAVAADFDFGGPIRHFHTIKPLAKGNLQKLLVLPSTVPAGFSAFFLAYHLPISPINVSRDFEMADGALLSPISNFIHDLLHYFRVINSLGSSGTIFTEETLRPLSFDLDKIRSIVQSKNDPTLTKVMHFIFFYIRFESGQALPPSSEAIADRLQAMLTHSNRRARGIFGQAYAKSTPEFTAKFEDFTKIVLEYNLQKKVGSGFRYKVLRHFINVPKAKR